MVKEEIAFKLTVTRDPKLMGLKFSFDGDLNGMEINGLCDKIQVYVKFYEHIVNSIFSNKFQRGCNMCKVAKKLSKKIKKNNIILGSRECSKLILGLYKNG